jgi:hypothetical protein
VSYGSDFVVIDTVDPNRCLVLGCMYYITVAGARDTLFTLAAATTGGNTLLLDGVKASGSVTLNASDQFSFVFSGKAFQSIQVAFEATPYGPTIMAYITDTIFEPSAASNRYALSPQYNIATITKDDTSCRLDSCVLLIAVIGTGKYSITARTESAIIAISDRMETGTILLHQELFFSRTFPLTYNPFDFVIYLRGYVTAYLACSPSAASSSVVIKPNSTHHTWKLVSWDIAELVIPVTGAESTYCFRSGGGSRVLITLEGEMTNRFSLRAHLPNATNHDDAPTLMAAGQTITGVIDDAEFQYYTIRPDIAREEIRSATVSVTVSEFVFVSASVCVACVLHFYFGVLHWFDELKCYDQLISC